MEEKKKVVLEAKEPVEKPLVKNIPMTNKKTKTIIFTAVITLLVVGSGIGTGWLLSGNKLAKTSGTGKTGETSKEIKVSDKEAGVDDESQFPDTAEGILEKGGIEGDGTHHLVREGGETKWVYLSSTVIDLSPFEDKKVQIWGQTLSGQTAGWLMDVGKIKVLE